MKQKILSLASELQITLFSIILLPIAYIMVAVLYGVSYVPEYQDSSQFLVMVEQTRNSIPSVLLIAGFLLIPQTLFDFVIRSAKKDKLQEAVTELNKTVQTLVQQNDMLLKKLESNSAEKSLNPSNENIPI